MSQEILENKSTTLVEDEKNVRYYEGHNYVGVRETVAYLFNDWSNSFNINSFSERYIWDIVNIDFTVSAAMNLVTDRKSVV